MGGVIWRTFAPNAKKKKYTSKAFLELHMDDMHPDWRHPKQKGWATPYGFGDFRQPVTYAEACKRMRVLAELTQQKIS